MKSAPAPADPALLSISQEDLAAYSEGRLEGARRAQVAGFLACNPDLAAEVMRKVHLRERSGAPASAASQARRVPRGARLVAAGLACAVAGWGFATGLDEDGPFEGLLKAPEYVEDAVMSWHATHLRIGMRSQTESTFDAAELQQTLSLRIPVLPRDWSVLDAQVYPSEEGPGISMLLQTAGGQLSLFAVRSDTAATSTAELTARFGTPAAYWELGGSAYVLTGEASPDEILAQATRLSHSDLM